MTHTPTRERERKKERKNFEEIERAVRVVVTE